MADNNKCCEWCQPGLEVCGTCVMFFSIDWSSTRCSAEQLEPACGYYEPINYCPNCGRQLKGGADNGQT